MIVIKYLDLVILAIALPIFVVAGWPLFGYAAGAVAWLVAARDQRRPVAPRGRLRRPARRSPD